MQAQLATVCINNFLLGMWRVVVECRTNLQLSVLTTLLLGMWRVVAECRISLQLSVLIGVLKLDLLKPKPRLGFCNASQTFLTIRFINKSEKLDSHVSHDMIKPVFLCMQFLKLQFFPCVVIIFSYFVDCKLGIFEFSK